MRRAYKVGPSSPLISTSEQPGHDHTKAVSWIGLDSPCESLSIHPFVIRMCASRVYHFAGIRTKWKSLRIWLPSDESLSLSHIWHPACCRSMQHRTRECPVVSRQLLPDSGAANANRVKALTGPMMDLIQVKPRDARRSIVVRPYSSEHVAKIRFCRNKCF